MDALFLLALLINIILSITLVPYIAAQKGRSAVGWAMLSLAASLLIALVALAALPARPRA